VSRFQGTVFRCDWCRDTLPACDTTRNFLPEGWKTIDHMTDLCPACLEARKWALGFAQHERLNHRDPSRVETPVSGDDTKKGTGA
jgi:hypothetical protein